MSQAVCSACFLRVEPPDTSIRKEFLSQLDKESGLRELKQSARSRTAGRGRWGGSSARSSQASAISSGPNNHRPATQSP